MTKTNTQTKTAAAAAKGKPATRKPAAPKAPRNAKADKVLHKPLGKADRVAVQRLKGNRKIKPLVKAADIAAKPGTWRHALISIALASKDTDSAKATLKAHSEFGSQRMDFGWLVANKFVAYAD